MIRVPDHPDISLKQLIQVHEDRKNNKKMVYESVYLQCCEKIRHINDQFYMTSCYFTVPGMQYGMPPYKIETCVVYVMVKLRRKGFQVEFMYPNRLWISWSSALTKALKKSDSDWYTISKESKLTTPSAPSPYGEGITKGGDPLSIDYHLLKSPIKRQSNGIEAYNARSSASDSQSTNNNVRWDYPLIRKKNVMNSSSSQIQQRRSSSNKIVTAQPPTTIAPPARTPPISQPHIFPGLSSTPSSTPPIAEREKKRESERDIRKKREQMEIENIIKRKNNEALSALTYPVKSDKKHKKILQIKT